MVTGTSRRSLTVREETRTTASMKSTTILCFLAVATSLVAEEPANLPRIIVEAEALPPGPDISASWNFDLVPMSTPIQATVLGEELIKAQGAESLEDVLWNSAGITTATGNGIYDFFVVRGVDSLNGGLTLVDGIPEPESTVYPMPLYEAIHILKGPIAFAHGPNALAGSVNLLRRQPVSDPFSRLDLTVGSEDKLRAVIDAGRPLSDDANGRITALYQDAESYRNGIESEILAVSPSVLLQLSDDQTLRIHYDYLRSDVIPDAGVPVFGDQLVVDSRSATFHLPGDDSEQEVHRILVEYKGSLNEQVALRSRTYYTRLDWQSQGTILAGFPLALTGLEAEPTTLARLRGVLDDDQNIFGEEVEFSTQIEAAGLEHELVLGLEVTRFTDKFTILIEEAPAIDLASGFTFPLPLPVPPPNTGDARSEIYSVYLHDQVVIDDRWSLVAGGRVDALDFEDDARGTSRSDTEFSPFGGLVMRASDQLAIFVNGGVGFAPPSTQVVGPRGEPEESLQIEAGLKMRSEDDDWFCQLSIYHLERDHISIPESAGIFTRNGSQESRGVEIEVQGEVGTGVRVLAAYAYLDSELETFAEMLGPFVSDRSGNATPFAPEHTLRLWGILDVSDSLAVALGMRAVDDQFIAPDNAYQIDSYATFDAAIHYTTDRWSLSVHVENLFGEDYATRGTASTSVIPEDDLSAYATLALTL